eukprot:TRINITY_DN10167_c0_g1_i1.p1 TRINITY_DN10167_c0_g1~~TRINITY_DN10167_c0_g1_i1.p1  ORF type:complete len:864 (-),score=140.62 TRINITY_DN10167_c0_g1_i1:257-2848(-)
MLSLKNSLKSVRFSTDNRLDISYLTDRVISATFKVEGASLFKRGTIDQVASFLESTHKGYYKVYNLCSHERTYDHAIFDNNVSEFELDPLSPPPLSMISKIIANLSSWLDFNPLNVAVVHCDKTLIRSAFILCCYLLATGRCSTPLHAVTFFDETIKDNKGRMRKGYTGLTLPSFHRYMQYFLQCMVHTEQPNRDVPSSYIPDHKLALAHIEMFTIPEFNSLGGCSPWFSISRKGKTLFYSKSIAGKRGKEVIEFDCCCTLIEGDIRVEFFNGSFSSPMFSVSFHTSFASKEKMIFAKRDVDGASDDEKCAHFSPDFKIILRFKNVKEKEKVKFDAILRNKVYLEAFHKHLSNQLCAENIEFYLDVIKYKSLPVGDTKSMIKTATTIKDTYITPGTAPKEINIRDATRRKVLEEVSKSPSHNTFDQAYNEVLTLLQTDSYPKFLASKIFTDIPQNLVWEAEKERLKLEILSPIDNNLVKPSRGSSQLILAKKFDTFSKQTRRDSLSSLSGSLSTSSSLDSLHSLQSLHSSLEMDSISIQQEVCGSCRRVISTDEPSMNLNGFLYHWKCLKCNKCNANLGSVNECVVKDDIPLCATCVEEFFPICYGCDKTITDSSLMVNEDQEDQENLVWHRTCRTCSVCEALGTERGVVWYEKDQKLYCDQHHPNTLKLAEALGMDEEELKELDKRIKGEEVQEVSEKVNEVVTPEVNSPTLEPPIEAPTQKQKPGQTSEETGEKKRETLICSKCKKEIAGEYRLIMVGETSKSFHVDCLVLECFTCKVPLVDRFGFRNEELYCEQHLYSHRCNACSKEITSSFLRTEDGTYHFECFCCSLCKMKFGNTAEYFEDGGQFYCEKCHAETFQSE